MAQNQGQWNQNQYGNQGGYPQQNQQQYGGYANQNQGGYPQQNQYNQQPQYNNNQNQGNWNNPPQQQYNQQPQQQQYNNQNQGNWNPPPNQQQYNQQPQQQQPQQQQPQQQQYDPNNPGPQQWSNEQSGGNWKGNGPPPNMQGGNTYTNKPKTKVTQKGNMTITETVESGGGSGRSTEYHGPPQLGPPQHLKSSGPHQPNGDQEQIDYFRLKLWEMNCCCGCGNTDHPCLNLWMWAIWWLIIFIFNGFLNFIGSVAQSSGGASGYATFAIIVIVVSICINVWALIALFKLWAIAFLVQLIMFVVFLVLVSIGIFVYPWSWGFFIMNVIFIICDIWAIVVFWRVWRWARHFKNGGNYDPEMTSPP